MALSQSARVHLIYQFIILTLLFLGVTLGCYTLLPVNQKSYMLYIIIPMLSSYTVIFACCLQVVPIPQWMDEPLAKQDGVKRTLFASDETGSLSCRTRRPAILSNPSFKFNGRASSSRVPLLANNHEVTEAARQISVEPFRTKASESVCISRDTSGISNPQRTEATTRTSRSLGVQRSNTSILPSNYGSIVPPESSKYQPLVSRREDGEEESELVKSYSYPIRQKRLEKWVESRRDNPSEGIANKNDIPYWQTFGYILAVKKAARDRRRVASGPCSTRRSRWDAPTADNQQESKKLRRDRSPTGSTFSTKSKIRLGLTSLFSRNKEIDKEVQGDDASVKASKGFSLFGRKKKLESKYYAVEEVPNNKSCLNKYGACSSHKNFLDPDSEDDPFEPDTLEDHLSLFPDVMNKLSRKEQDSKK